MERNIISSISHPSLFGDIKCETKFTINLDNNFLYSDNCTAKGEWFKKSDYFDLYKNTFIEYKKELNKMFIYLLKFEREYKLKNILS